jgi:cell division protein FtsB
VSPAFGSPPPRAEHPSRRAALLPSPPKSALLKLPSPQRVFLALLPALVIASLAASALWGESGLLARHQLRGQLARANDSLADTERENQRLLRELRLMDQDPLLLERMVAEELGWGRQGDVIYRFADDEQAD